MKKYEEFNSKKGKPIKSWTRGVQFEHSAKEQVFAVSELPIIYKWIAIMPDVHTGIGATIGSVIPTEGAIIPSAVGVDIGCGMVAQKLTLKASDLPKALHATREEIEGKVPHGRSYSGRRGDKGAWSTPPNFVHERWEHLQKRFEKLTHEYPIFKKTNNLNHLGTLGGGNHFIEICIDEDDYVWIMLHSGSRGIGNKIGSYFIDLARKKAKKKRTPLPNADLAYFTEGSKHFDDYYHAVLWAQEFAKLSREIMMEQTISALASCNNVPDFSTVGDSIDCHHNYVTKEEHYGKEVYITRKGAISARKDELGIIPGSMGVKSFIVRGLGNEESFHSCSHGAGRLMSRRQAKKKFTTEDHIEATAGVECRKDSEVLDETPGAYKSIDEVMEAQSDLVEVVHTLKQVICIKG